MEKKTNYSIQTLLESRSFLYVLLLIVTICFVSTYTKIYDVKLDMNGDNIHYYALGKALAEGKGFTNTISFSETPHTHFPPGYPVFVAGVMKFFPDNINAVKIANGILLYAAILLLFFLLKKISGSIIVAFLTCMFCSIHAEILRYATIMMSEMLFLFCSVAAIFLMLSIKPEQLFTKKGVRDTVLLVLLLFLGMFMDVGASILILGPLLAPVAVAFGIDPIQFGVIFVFSMAIGQATPPFGTDLFVVCGFSGRNVMAVGKHSLLFCTALVAVILLCIFIPQVATALPGIMV